MRVLPGDHDAIVRFGSRTAVAHSTLPLRFASRPGATPRPLSTDLRPYSGGLAPEHTLSSYRIAGRVTGGGSALRFDRARFGVTPARAIGASVRRVGGKALYADVARDTDLLVTPLPTGADVLWQLRSADSPGTLGLDVHGVEAIRLQRGGAARLLRAGRVVGTMAPPQAVDADGRAVATRWHLRRGGLAVTVAHSSSAVRYPVLVDPFVTDDQRYWLANGALDFKGWQYVGSPTYVAGAQGVGPYGNGLNLATYAGRPVPASVFGQYTFKARSYPGAYAAEGAHIFKADFGYTAANVGGAANACWVEGIYNSTAARWEDLGRYRGADVAGQYTFYPFINGVRYPFTSCSNEGTAPYGSTYGYRVHCLSTCGVDGGDSRLGSPGNSAVLGLLPNAGTSSGAYVFMGSSLIFESEGFAPRISSGSVPPGWVDVATLSASASDYGMGVAALSASAPGWGGASLSPRACLSAGPREGGTPGSSNNGDRNHACNLTEGLAFGTAGMPEGSYSVSVQSRDVLDNASSAAMAVKVDHNPPALTVTGALRSDANGFARSGDSAHVVATDAASGARSLDVRIDGAQQGAPTTCATDGCSTVRDITLPTTLAEGAHTIAVTATDVLGHAASTSWSVRVDATLPEDFVGGDAWGADGYVLSGGSYGLSLHAEDGSAIAGAASGIRLVTVRVDPGGGASDAAHVVTYQNQGCSANACPTTFEPAAAWSYVSSVYGDGDHAIEVDTEDGAGNVDRQSVGFSVTHATPLSPQTLSLGGQGDLVAQGVAPGDRLGASVADVDDVNGDGLPELLVGAPGVDGNGSDTGAAYLILGSATPGPVRLDGTDPRVLRFATGAAGANLGAAVATEDVNGDEVPDLILGAPGSAPGGLLPPVQGRVWVVFGRPDLPRTVNLDNLGADGYQIKGPALSGGLIPPLFSSGATSTFGGQIGGRRSGDFGVDADVNGDGRDDLVLGAGNATSPSLTSGVAYVLFGKADTGTIDLGALSGDPGSNGFRITGSEPILDVITPGQAGTSTALPGDVNGDDLADVLVTEPGVDPSGRSGAGSAYLIYGRPGGGLVGLASLGSAGMAIRGGAGDGVATAASLGDVDSDGTPDLLLGGHGAWVVFGRPANTPVDLAASTDSYRLQAPSGSGFDRAQVTGAGDQDGDSIPDAIVGFPEASAQQGVSYLAYGKLDPSTLDLGTLRGDQGARLDGTSQSRAGIASAGQDATTDAQEPSTTVGAPMATGSMGQATTIRRPMLTAAMLRPTKCATGTVAFPYRGDTKAPLPICRVALHKTVDIPLGGKAVRGTYNPSPRCGAYSTKKGSRCYPTAYHNGNASVSVYELTTPGEIVDVVDSFETPIAKLSEPYYGCFNVYDAAGVFKSSTDPAAPAGCDPSQPHAAQARLVVQGRGCMAKPADEARNYLAGLISAPNGSGAGTGLRGFIDRSKFPASMVKASGNDLERAYSGCGLPRKRAKPITGTEVDDQLKTTADFVTQSPNGQALDQYLNRETLRIGCQDTPTKAGCTGYYGNYQGGCFMANVAYLTTSTTGVSRAGNPLTPVESNRGGVVRAVVPRDSGSFVPYDTFGYRDRNEPTPQGLVARWTFGDANQGADTVNASVPEGSPDRQQHIFGWTVSRSPLVDPSLYTCPLPSAP